MNHDVLVIGASAGGPEVLLDMVPHLPADLPASVFVVLHTPPTMPSPLPELLSRRGRLPATHPLHGEKILPGRIYIAPPDNHLLLRDGSMQVVRGAKENGHRPAVDALFRSASAAYGSRVVGVVLSGYQDCGTAGMMSIQARGGATVVQAPETALVDEMPRSVIKRIRVDHVVPPSELPALLARLAAAPAAPPKQPEPVIDQLEGTAPGRPAELVCPMCAGVLTEAEFRGFHQFRCHVGHAFTLDTLVREQGEAMERAMWAAVRALEESAALALRLSITERGDLRARFAEKAATHAQQAEFIRQTLLHGTSLAAGVTPALTQ